MAEEEDSVCPLTIEKGALYLVEERLETFKRSHWPYDDGPCTPLKVAEAGFYYCGSSTCPDLVRCVVCHHELEGWEPNDKPRDEHKHHNPTCNFLKISNKDPYKLTVGDIIDMEKAALENYIAIEAKKLEKDLQAHVEETKDQLLEKLSEAKKKKTEH